MPPNRFSTKLLIVCLIASSISLKINAQSQATLDSLRPHILVKARAQKGRVLLRWAVDKPTEWQKANKSGFIVERYTKYISRDSQLRFTRSTLTPSAIMALPLEKWRTIIEKDDNAAIIAQSLYGGKFGVTQNDNKPKNMSDMMGVTDELTLRHSFALLSADMNFEAACMAGWGFVDSMARPNQEYYYRIYLANDKADIKVDTGVAMIFTGNTDSIPSPLMFKGQFSNKVANLSWDNERQANQYTSYILERSEDNINFTSATKKPIINLNNSEQPLPMFLYNDSLPSNNKMYYYRLTGITCFGEKSIYTPVVKGIGRERISYSPNIAETDVLNDSTVVIKWNIQTDSTIKLLSSFELSVSDQMDGNYKVVAKDINKNARSATFVGPLSSNYFIVSAVDVNGEKYSSFAQLVQTIDSIPPAAPIGLEGFIDSMGIVQLKWQANSEKDLYGYHIFKSNVEEEEMSLVTGEPVSINAFSDTISNNLGNEKIFYTVVALDQRFNQSQPSKIATVKRPDKNPPVPPVFNNFKLEEEKVHLFWENSASDDIAVVRLYKKIITNTANDDAWELEKEFSSLDSVSYVDTKVKQGSVVGYTLMAIDKSKNESAPSVPLTVQIPIDRRDKAAVKELHAVADRKSKKILVEWVYGEKNVAEYQIYKTAGKQPLSLWKVAENTTVAIIDEDISPSNLYKYAVRAVFKDGTMSQWKEVNVEF
jgi:uncharacterized protein